MIRPYILGVNQPQVGKPALWPDPPGCAGWRLWKMVEEICGIEAGDWVNRTERHNLLSDAVLPRDWRGAVKRRGRLLEPYLEGSGRTIVLLGAEVGRAVDHDAPWLEWSPRRPWVMIPHPSGKCQMYNDPAVRRRVGELLTEVLER